GHLGDPAHAASRGLQGQVSAPGQQSQEAAGCQGPATADQKAHPTAHREGGPPPAQVVAEVDGGQRRYRPGGKRYGRGTGCESVAPGHPVYGLSVHVLPLLAAIAASPLNIGVYLPASQSAIPLSYQGDAGFSLVPPGKLLVASPVPQSMT